MVGLLKQIIGHNTQIFRTGTDFGKSYLAPTKPALQTALHHHEYRQRYRRELPRIAFVGAVPNACHPEAPSFGAGGSMQPGGSADAVDESIDPSARKKRGPQDDNAKPPASSVPPVVKDVEVFGAFSKVAGSEWKCRQAYALKGAAS